MNSSSTNPSPVLGIALTLQSVYMRMFFWVPVLILIPGFFLNLFASSVFMRKKYWKTSIGYYYTLFPLVSNLPVLVGIISFLPVSLGYDSTLQSVEACKAMFFFRVTTNTAAQYFHVLMSIDRALSILYPKRFAWLYKLSNHVIATVVMYLLVSVYVASTIWDRRLINSYITKDNQTVLRSTSCQIQGNMLVYSNITNLVWRFLGIILIFASNSLIIKKLVESKKITKPGQKTLTSRQYTFAFSLIAINVVAILLALPFLAVLLMQLVLSFMPDSPSYLTFLSYFLYNIVVLFNYVFYALPFFMYYFSNKLFRSRIMSVLCSPQEQINQSNTA